MAREQQIADATIIKVLIFAFCAARFPHGCFAGPSNTYFLQSFLEDYDSRIPPSFDNVPTEVAVSVKFDNIDSISEVNMEFSTNIFLTQEWVDDRLRFFSLIKAEYLELDTKMMNYVWVPDLYIANEKTSSFHSVTVPNKMMHIFRNGTVRYKARLSLTASCPMKLHKYPFDKQTCSLKLRSFAYSTKNIILAWRKMMAITHEHLELPQFRLVGIRHFNQCEPAACFYGSHYTTNCSSRQDDFSCIRAELMFERELGYYLIQLYIPSMLVVCLSWVSFWLSIEAVPARTSLGILTVLTMTTQRSAATVALPRVSYIKAIDVWMASCLLFVISALLEYAFANVRLRTERCHQSFNENSSSYKHESSPEEQDNMIKVSKFQVSFGYKSDNIDKISRVAFPLVFVLFCVLYWVTYVYLVPDYGQEM